MPDQPDQTPARTRFMDLIDYQPALPSSDELLVLACDEIERLRNKAKSGPSQWWGQAYHFATPSGQAFSVKVLGQSVSLIQHHLGFHLDLEQITLAELEKLIA